MTTRVLAPILAVALSACAAPARAAPPASRPPTPAASVSASSKTTVDASYAVKADAHVDIEIFAGNVRVVGTAKNEVHVSGTGSGGLQVSVGGSPESMRVRAGPSDSDDFDRDSGRAELIVSVPFAASVRVRGMNVGVDVRDVKGGRVKIEIPTGKIGVTGAPSEIEVRAVSADVDVNAQTKKTQVRTVSGASRLKGVSGAIAVSTVSGDLAIAAGGEVSELDARSVSGEMSIDATLADGANVTARSHSGRVRVKLPASANADVELRSRHGALESRFGGAKNPTPDSLELRLGKGGASVRVKTFSGDVTIEPRS